MEPATADALIRSRTTVLDILEDRGYDATPYRNISPDQILTLAESPRALDIYINKKDGSLAPCERAVVVYLIHDRIRLKVQNTVNQLYTVPPDNSDQAITDKDDLIVILNEPYNEVFDREALHKWQNDKTRITFFHIKHVVVHLGRHELVPKHRKLTVAEATELMASLHVTQKSQFPLIKHADIQSRILGLVPGDFVEILRPSPTAGTIKYHRICVA